MQKSQWMPQLVASKTIQVPLLPNSQPMAVV